MKEKKSGEALKTLRKVITFPTVYVILLLVIGVGLFNLAQNLIAPSRISDELKEQMAQTNRIMKVEICYNFTPEDFHIKMMQSYGSIAGVTDHSIFLMYVSPENIEKVAKIYWVDKVQLPG